MKYNFLLFIFGVIIMGCNNEKSNQKILAKLVSSDSKISILGNWRLSDVSQIGLMKNEDALLAEAIFKKTVQQGLIFSFYADGVYTSITGIGNYDYGKWNFVNNKKAIYIESNISKDTLLIKSDNKNDNELLYVIQKNKNIKSTFSRPDDIDKDGDVELDPYYTTNNTWRIKPTKAENPQQIQDRLGNYIRHLAYILKQASDKKLRSVSFEFSQGIIKIYNGGIGINSTEEVSLNWINTYYSKEQALVAYKMFEAYLRSSNSYKGGSSGEWYKDDYNILTSIYGDLKEGKFPLIIEKK